MKLFLLILGCALSYLCGSAIGDAGKVIFVNLLWRHGERTPVKFNVRDPFQDRRYWPEGNGQLTNAGKRQQYELGRWLRRRYDHLLGDSYSADLVRVRSTDKDRAIMSALANMAGMFPPRGRQVWNQDLLWQPIPVHNMPEELDKVLVAEPPCPAYDKEFERVYQSDEIQRVIKEYEDVFDAIRKNAADAGDVIDFKYIYDTLDTLTLEKNKGFPLPEWAKGIMSRMREVQKYRFLIDTWTKKLARIKSGLLIEEMIQNMQNRAERSSSRVANIYSAHDTTIANLLHTLGMYTGESPPLTSCVMVELREVWRGDHFVTVFTAIPRL